jgi:ABC-type phosphate/phosphonate transport system substrate-binding protein
MRIASLIPIACVVLSAMGASGQSVPEGRPVRLGMIAEIYAGVNAHDARVAMQLWIDALLRQTEGGYQGSSVVFPDVGQAIAAMRQGELEGLNLASVDYLWARNQIDLEPNSVGIFANGQILQAFVLLVRRDTGPPTLADLRGGKLRVNELDWQTARLWLEVVLKREGLPDSHTHFGEIRPVKGTSQQVLPVFFGQADACIVTVRGFATLTELNPQLAHALTPLARSPAYLLYLMCLAPGLDEALRQAFVDMGLGLHRDPTGRQMLTLFGLERVGRFRPEYLDSLEELVTEYERLTGEKVK